jgi:3-deoxy-7-phosphoheptulonate synthase
MISQELNVRKLFPEGQLKFIAGPCSVEGKDQIFESAKFLSSLGITILRGGAFKPRTSPDTFQGLGEEGLKIMKQACEKYGMVMVTEVMGSDELELVSDYADILQIGSRNCQNFSLLKDVSIMEKPVLLKRGFGNTVEEFYQASRYLSSHGNEDIILVERGIRTFENSTRFTLDISAIPVLRKKVKYPIIVDPSHPAGKKEYVTPLALASVGAGADGLMVETHPEPEKALSDREQQLNFKDFKHLYDNAMRIGNLRLYS